MSLDKPDYYNMSKPKTDKELRLRKCFRCGKEKIEEERWRMGVRGILKGKREMTSPVHEESNFWAVRIDDSRGSDLAVGGDGTGPKLFWNKPSAKQFCDKLQKHLELKCSVIRVYAVIDEIHIGK